MLLFENSTYFSRVESSQLRCSAHFLKLSPKTWSPSVIKMTGTVFGYKQSKETRKRTCQKSAPLQHDKVKLNVSHWAEVWPLLVKEDILEGTWGVTCCISRGISQLQWSGLVLKLHKVSKCCKLMFCTKLLKAVRVYLGTWGASYCNCIAKWGSHY